MGLAVIGAGFGRTGTMSLKLALEQLGFDPCFHMAEFFKCEDPEAMKDKWERAVFGARPMDWDTLFEGYRATVDWPSTAFWRELAEHYPQAKVILTLRDAERWYTSTQETIFRPDPDNPLAERTDNWGRMVYRVINQDTFAGDTSDKDHCISVYNRHNAAVKAALPPERLLVYTAGEGWEPLCAFLGVPVPDTPFPRENTTDAFKARRAEEKAAAASGEAG